MAFPRRHHALLAVPLAVLSLCAGGLPPCAFADTPAPSTQPAAPAPAPAAAAAVDKVEEAKRHFSLGAERYLDADYEQALIEFQRSYEYVPTFKTLYNIGQVNLQLKNYASAYRALKKYLNEGKNQIPAARKAQVESDLKDCEARTARLSVIVKVDGAKVTLDDDEIGATPMTAPILVNAGRHKVEVSKLGYVTATKTVTLAGRDELQLKLDLIQEGVLLGLGQGQTPHKEINWRAVAITSGWATTGGLVLGTGILGALALSSYSKYKSDLNSQTTAQAFSSAQSSTRTLSLATDIVGGAALAAAGISVYLTLTHPKPKKEATSGLDLGLNIAANNVSLTGQF